MKFLKSLILTAGLMLCGASAFAQGNGFDLFGAVRTVVVVQPTNLVGSVIASTWSNSLPVDIRGMAGIVKLDLNIITNQAGQTTTWAILKSQDQTNWSLLNNVAFATNTTITYSNNYYPQQLTAANSVNLPGNVVTPTANTAGFATGYVNPVPFSANATNTVGSNAGGIVTIGFDAQDAGSYLEVVIYPTGTKTNLSVSAILTGRLLR